MNGWYLISWALFIIAAVLVLVAAEPKYVEVFVLGGVAFFALGHGSVLAVGRGAPAAGRGPTQ